MTTMRHQPFVGLVAATHTPFRADGSLNLSAVEKQASHLLHDGVRAVFIGGTTGESLSLSLDERRQLTERWIDVVRGTPLRVVVHVGGNCLGDARALAAQAQARGAAAIAAMAPSYFSPKAWVNWSNGARPSPAPQRYAVLFLRHSLHDQCRPADAGTTRPGRGPDPQLRGPEIHRHGLDGLQSCLRAQAGRYNVLWGYDENLLAALALAWRRGRQHIQLRRAAVPARDRLLRGGLSSRRPR